MWSVQPHSNPSTILQQHQHNLSTILQQSQHNLSTISPQPHRNLSTTSLQSQHNLTTTSAQSYNSLSTTSAQSYSNLSTTSAQSHHNLMAISAQPHCNLNTISPQPQHNLTTVSAQPEHNLTTISAQPQHNRTTISEQPQHNLTTISAQPQHNITTTSAVVVPHRPCVSVAVSCFTLVAISLERYFAICHPLKSRSWQTLSHSYKAITVCWVGAFLLMVPSAVYHDLVEIRPHIHACREIWPSSEGLKVFTVTLNLLLLVLPCIIMSWAYGCVSYTLWIGIKLEKQSEKETQNKVTTAEYDTQNGVSLCLKKKIVLTRDNNDSAGFQSVNSVSGQTTCGSSKYAQAATRPVRRMDAHRAMRQSNTERSRAAKKRVIKMLFMIVLEFFIFWSPTFILDTWVAFHLASARRHITPMTKSLIHLVSYVSACCNPITYCFMNKNFRQSFLMAFRCMKTRYVYANRSQMSFTSGNTMSTRTPATPSMATSYDKIVDSDEISENSF